MKTIAFAGVVAAALLSGVSAASAEFRAFGGDFICKHTAQGTSCVRDFIYKKQKRELYRALVKLGYPGEIVTTSQADYYAAKGGWKRHGRCVVQGKDVSRDPRVNRAKLVYCELSKRGHNAPLPKIVKAF